jgi:hypothetical protein
VNRQRRHSPLKTDWIGQRLQRMYLDILQEQVPQDWMDLVRRLDDRRDDDRRDSE